MQRDRASLEDIVLSMRDVVEYVGNRTLEQLTADRVLSDAVLRRLEIIGEAVKRLSHDLRTDHPNIPWQTMAGMRDRLIHGYDDVSMRTVHDVITRVIPPLIPQVQAMIDCMPEVT